MHLALYQIIGRDFLFVGGLDCLCLRLGCEIRTVAVLQFILLTLACHNQGKQPCLHFLALATFLALRLALLSAFNLAVLSALLSARLVMLVWIYL